MQESLLMLIYNWSRNGPPCLLNFKIFSRFFHRSFRPFQSLKAKNRRQQHKTREFYFHFLVAGSKNLWKDNTWTNKWTTQTNKYDNKRRRHFMRSFVRSNTSCYCIFGNGSIYGITVQYTPQYCIFNCSVTTGLWDLILLHVVVQMTCTLLNRIPQVKSTVTYLFISENVW